MALSSSKEEKTTLKAATSSEVNAVSVLISPRFELSKYHQETFGGAAGCQKKRKESRRRRRRRLERQKWEGASERWALASIFDEQNGQADQFYNLDYDTVDKTVSSTKGRYHSQCQQAHTTLSSPSPCVAVSHAA